MQRDLIKTLLWLAGIVCLHVIAIFQFETLSLGDALWLTLTTATTVGYGDISPSTPQGRLVTIMLIYGVGIFIMGKFVGDYFEYRSHRHELKLKGQWRWNMRGHIVVLNSPINHSRQYFERLVHQFRLAKQFRKHPIQILTTNFATGLPQSLREMGVVHYQGEATDPQALQAVSICDAGIIVVLAYDEGNMASDGIVFDILHRLKDLKLQGKILAECVDDRNRNRLLEAGADAVIRPIRAYPAMIIRAFTAPGAEQVIENLFNNEGDEYQRFDLKIRQRWGWVVSRLVNADVGIPIAFVAAEGQRVVCNPRPETEIDAVGLLVMVREGNSVTSNTVREALTTPTG
jgi:voltage-gated potassium channel